MSEDFNKQYESYFNSGGDESKISEAVQMDSPDSGEPEKILNSEPEVQFSAEHDEQEEVTITLESEGKESQSESEPQETEEAQESKSEEISNNLNKALKEERQKRQELDRQLKEIQSESQQTREALQALLAPQQQAEVPNYDDDPVGYLKWQNDLLSQNFQKQQQYIQQTAQQQQAYQTAVNLNNEYTSLKQERVQTNPEFENVTSFLENSVLNEYKALGYDDNTSKQLLMQDKLTLLADAKTKGMNVLDLIQGIAEARGYSAQPVKANTAKLANVKDGINKSKSLSGAGGVASNKTISLEDISNLTDKELEQVMQQYKNGSL